ncbi:RXT2-like protein [Tricladium varicosporioides]|nr:RXT2-like protein [Hymenoscyphus varicosporioides]
MASQAAIFAETIAGMKKALKRKSYDSESDSSTEQLTNRGNKLRRKSRFVQEGQLAAPTGPQVYKKRIEHAGFYREVISQNPLLIDEDGYEVDSDEDDERAQTAIAAAAEFDPYADIKIEQLLMPLTAAADLQDHPTLSKPFTSNTLTELTRHAREMVQKEKASLWRIKHLLTRLSGDNTWIPCESLGMDDDISLFFEDRDKARASMLGKILAKDDADQASTGTLVSDEAEQPGLLTVEAQSSEISQPITSNGVRNANSVTSIPEGQKEGTNEMTSNTDMYHSAESLGNEKAMNGVGETVPKALESSAEEVMEMDGAVKPPAQELIEGQEMAVDVASETDVTGILDETGDNSAPRRMRTRAQAQAASDNAASSRTRSATPEFDNDLLVHPYFLAPRASQADRDVGLPQHEAEETRRLLQLYIQKQEEVCRGAQRIYDGLLRANRHRKLVMKWCKAEAHVGVNRDMSDGEDWYDKEEWGLDEDLKKGQDEEEEDAATTAKKTRSRRQ